MNSRKPAYYELQHSSACICQIPPKVAKLILEDAFKAISNMSQ